MSTPRASRPMWTGRLTACAACPRSKEPESLSSRLHETRVPVRLLVGTAPHKSSVKDEEIALMTSQIPDFRVELVSGAGQYIHEEQPAVVLAAFSRLAEMTSASR